MKVTLATALAGVISTATALKGQSSFAVLRFTNKQLTQGRMDPIVNPGVASSHVHTVMGGSGFSLSSNGDDLSKSKCSNAMVKGDNSNYWFPSVYFKDPKDGTFEPVEVFYVNAYYFFDDTNDVIKAFPLGMSMVSGNATTRVVPAAGGSGNKDPSKGPINPARWTCPRSSYDPPSYPPDSDGSMAGIGDAINKGEGTGFPDMNCDGYASPLRADIHFPSCYNPDAGLTKFQENMAWPEDNNGKLDCPKGYTHVPHLFLEVYWDTPKFVDRWEQGTGHQPFVLSSGDATGFSSHADFMSGWDEKLLQHIIDTCDAGTGGMDTCPGLFYGLNEGECTIESAIDEKIDGVLDKLPGNNPIQGWAYGVTGGSMSPPAGGDSSSSSSASVAPSATVKASDDETTTSASLEEIPTVVPEETTTEAADAEATSESKASVVPSKSATVSVAPPAVSTTFSSKLTKPTEIVNPVIEDPAKSSCKGKNHTVYRTVTVTQTAPGSAAETGAHDTYKRDQLQQHARNHARRHRSLRR